MGSVNCNDKDEVLHVINQLADDFQKSLCADDLQLKELNALKQWKAHMVEEMCKYDCETIEEVYQKGYEAALKEK